MTPMPTGQQTLAPRLEDRDRGTDPKVIASFPEVLRRLREMVIRRRDEEKVHRLRNLDLLRMHEHQTQGRDPTVVRHAAQVIEHALPRIEREHHAVGLNRAREAEGEVARARTEIADDHAGSDIEGRDHRVRIAQPILTRPAGVQPSPHRSWQAIERHPQPIGFRSIRVFEIGPGGRPAS